MIAYVRGTLVEKGFDRVIVEAAGVGYELFISLSTYDKLPREGEDVKLLAWHCVREDDEMLFGFAAKEEREMFLKLTQVSGVGPKIALAILSGTSIGELSLAIASGNAKLIASVKGVGKKTAEKICVELKDKVNAIAALAATSKGARDDGKSLIARDAILALSALGFGEEVANKMVASVIADNPQIADVESVIRMALSKKKS
ncbi:MAG: Holliday junction branch migration protein RuvA [Kiritimatiellae bacterium]|nr:Holliday junction branch migration protein RuvA [Kiritimatiellia bacterium]